MASNQNQNSSTITGDVKSRIDKIWDTLWAGGITVPVTILEQLTYLFFIKLLDDPKDVFARIEVLEAQFIAKQQEFKEKYLGEN